MSLYNLLFGQNQNTDIILAILELKENDIQRYRDCGFTDTGIYIYTRTGGGNREEYQNDKLVNSPYYISDEDDDFDCTYATYYFKLPDNIKEDVEKFKNFRKEGITAKFIQWVCKTLEREESENDIRSKLWKKQNQLVKQSTQTFICETNGHTIVPLNDRSLETYLDLMENVGGSQLGYSVMPYKIEITENVPRWYLEDSANINTEMCRVKISFPRKWEIDNSMWNRWKIKYGEKYPNAINTIEKYVNL